MPIEKDVSIDKFMRLGFLIGITYVVFVLLFPFLGILAWGSILAIALYPAFTWLNTRLGNHSVITAIILTLFSLIVLVGIIGLLTNNMVETLSSLAQKIRSDEKIFLFPSKAVEKWPLIGEYIYQAWSSLSSNLSELFKYSSYLVTGGSYLLKKMAMQGFDFILFILAIIFSGYLMVNATSLIDFIRKLSKHLTPNHESNLIEIVKKTIQNVSRGIIGISLLQSLLFGLLLLIAEIPGAGLFSFVGLILCIVQVGLFILVLPIAIWLFFVKSFAVALTLTILLVLVTFIDNLLKPIILSRGLKTPMIFIFLGVIGGVISYGLIGIFIGPVILAVFYDLITHWYKQAT